MTWKKAWWSLSDEQRDYLAEQRREGMFGGVGVPIYWYVQEVGMEEVGIGERAYMRRSQEEFAGRFQDYVRRLAL